MPRRIHRTNRRNTKRRNTKRRNLRKYKGGVNIQEIGTVLPNLNDTKTFEELGINISNCTITKKEDSKTNPYNSQFDWHPDIPAKYELNLDGYTITFS